MFRIFFLCIALLLASSCNNSVKPKQSQAEIPDGIYLLKEMAEKKSDLSIEGDNEAIIGYSHAYLDDKEEKINYYLIQSEPFVPLIIKSKPEIFGDSNRLSELQISLIPKYTKVLEQFTTDHKGKRVVIVIEGEAVTRHKIREPVIGGRLKITRCTDHACEFLSTALEDNVHKGGMNKTSTIVLALSLIIIMLGMGLSLKTADFKRILIYPKAILTGLVNQLVLLPIIALILVSIFPLAPEIAIGVMILAACPGGPTSNLITHLAKGDTALSVTLTAVNSIITIFTIPFIVNFALVKFMSEGQDIQLDIPKTILQIFVIVIIPVAIGMLIRHYKEPFAHKMAKPVRIASGVVLALVIVGIIIKEKENVIPYFQQAGWITLALNVISMGIGYFSARILKIANKQAISISIESGIQNGTMAISIATVLLDRADFAIAPAIYSLIMFFTGGIIVFYSLKMKNQNTPTKEKVQ